MPVARNNNMKTLSVEKTVLGLNYSNLFQSILIRERIGAALCAERRGRHYDGNKDGE